MLLPWAEVAPPAELLAGTFDAPAVAAGFALAGAGEDDPEAGGVAAEPADVPPRLVT